MQLLFGQFRRIDLNTKQRERRSVARKRFDRIYDRQSIISHREESGGRVLIRRLRWHVILARATFVRKCRLLIRQIMTIQQPVPIMADKTTAFGVFMACAKFRYIAVVHKPPANAGNYTMAPNKVRN